MILTILDSGFAEPAQTETFLSRGCYFYYICLANLHAAIQHNQQAQGGYAAPLEKPISSTRLPHLSFFPKPALLSRNKTGIRPGGIRLLGLQVLLLTATTK